jgi:hypothetical protein
MRSKHIAITWTARNWLWLWPGRAEYYGWKWMAWFGPVLIQWGHIPDEELFQ